MLEPAVTRSAPLKVTSDETKVVLAKKLHADKSVEIDDICKTLRMSRSTFYRCVRH